jgi:hypothetical protein
MALLSEHARLRIHEQIANELVTSATENVNRLRRTLVTTSDPLERHRVAYEVPEAERELAKWKRAHADYQRRRELTKYAIRDAARALTL